jgi:hypothetical protein
MLAQRVSRCLRLAAAALLIISVGGTFADARDNCSVDRLHGLYVFSASGFVTGGPSALPMAIVELIRFNGDGTASVPGVAVNVNGAIFTPPGATGTYTVSDVVPPDAACTGSITFSTGQTLTLYFPLNADTIWMIQTQPPVFVLQGTATKLAR